MKVFRPSNGSNFQSPTRQIFGIHPTNNKILVHLDLGTLMVGSNQPDFNLPVNGQDILNSDTGALVGSIELFSVSPVGNISPIVTLKPDIPIDDQVKKIIIPTVVNAGDTVNLNNFQGKILPSMHGNTNLIDIVPYPLDLNFTISAFRVQFGTTFQPEDIGSPIIMQNGSTLGMLLTQGATVFIFPSSLIDS